MRPKRMTAPWRGIALPDTIRHAIDARIIRSSGTFDREWYLARYPDVRRAGVDPLRHFLLHGHAEGRYPNPIFATGWYRRRYADALGAGDNPLVDYLRSRGDGSRRPNPWFDPLWYARAHPDAERVEPMAHFLAQGAERGLDPGPHFNSKRFAIHYPAIRHHEIALGNFLHRYLVGITIQHCRFHFVSGWTTREIGPMVRLDIRVNGVSRGSASPVSPLPEVSATLGLEAKGFVFEFEPRLRPGDWVEIRSEVESTIGVARQVASDWGWPEAEQAVYDPRRQPAPFRFLADRAAIAARFLRGRGVEVGAFDLPTDPPPASETIYCDRALVPSLAAHHDALSGRPLIAPDIVCDAATLSAIAPGSLDFVIANHVIEHLEDPIAFLDGVASALRPGGRAMIVAPDKRFSFDSRRPITSFAHLVEDHARGPRGSRLAHLREFARLVDNVPESGLDSAVAQLDRNDRAMHFHVWDFEAFRAFVTDAIRTFSLPLALIHAESGNEESTMVLEKSDGAGD
jgi:predicted SAM-dependent methyltransferase